MWIEKASSYGRIHDSRDLCYKLSLSLSDRSLRPTAATPPLRLCAVFLGRREGGPYGSDSERVKRFCRLLRAKDRKRGRRDEV